MIINPHRIQTKNIGDLLSTPLKYFQFGQESREVEITSLKESELRDNHVIVGGGGLMDHKLFFRHVAKLCKLRDEGQIKSLTFWGVGTNAHLDRASCMFLFQNLETEKAINSADFAGIRDSQTAHTYVPCSTCMDESFDEYRLVEPTHNVVCYEHESIPLREHTGAPLMKNNQPQEMSEALEFLSSGDVVLTNTFHGAYWALLLGRRVVCNPFSTKFISLSDIPGYTSGSEYLQAREKPSEDFLKECRDKNNSFYKEVMLRISKD